jgi:hypothetical protein
MKRLDILQSLNAGFGQQDLTSDILDDFCLILAYSLHV